MGGAEAGEIKAGLGEGGGIETVRQQGYRFSLDTIPEAGSTTPSLVGTPIAP